MKINVNPVRGSRDFLPEDMRLRNYVKDKIINVYKKAGFTEIKTPAIENIDLLLGSKGGENLKLIYKIMKRGNKLKLNVTDIKENDLVDMGLRYDLTLPLSRFYANNHSKLPSPFKSIQIGEVYRADRPQKGRYRSFVQCDIDIIGEKTDIAELDLLITATDALGELGFRDYTIRINDRRILSSLIQYAGFGEESIENICITYDKIDKIGIEGVKKELLRIGYDDVLVANLVKVIDELSDKDVNYYSKIGVKEEIIKSINNIISSIDVLSQGQLNVIFDPTLVRGMGYYTGMIFEVESNELNCSIAGGGRYDNMIGNLVNKEIPAVGFSIGFERIITILEDKQFEVPQDTKFVYLYDEQEDIENVMVKIKSLRKQGKIVSIVNKSRKVGKQIYRLKNQGYEIIQ